MYLGGMNMSVTSIAMHVPPSLCGETVVAPERAKLPN